MESIKQSIEEMTQMFNSRMATFQQDLQSSATSEHSESPSAKLSREFNTFKSFVVNALQSLQTQVQMLSNLNDQMEMRSRRKILLFHGVPENDNDLQASVTEVICSKLRISGVDSSSIKYCNRLGRQRKEKPRPIVVKFCDMALRSKVWNAKTNLKQMGITISEFLTRKRHTVFLAARERYGQSKCWTSNGTILVIGPDGSRHHVHSMEDLDAIKCPTSSTGPRQPTATNSKTEPGRAASRNKRNVKAK